MPIHPTRSSCTYSCNTVFNYNKLFSALNPNILSLFLGTQSFQRITEDWGWKGLLRYSRPFPYSEQGELQQVTRNCLQSNLDISKDREPIISTGKLFQNLITLTERKSFLEFKWNFNLCPLPFVLSLCIPEKNLAPFIPLVIYTYWQDTVQALSSLGWIVPGWVSLNLFSQVSL